MPLPGQEPTWRIVREGRLNLICLIKGHTLCSIQCKECGTHRGHCAGCDATYALGFEGKKVEVVEYNVDSTGEHVRRMK